MHHALFAALLVKVYFLKGFAFLTSLAAQRVVSPRQMHLLKEVRAPSPESSQFFIISV